MRPHRVRRPPPPAPWGGPERQAGPRVVHAIMKTGYDENASRGALRRGHRATQPGTAGRRSAAAGHRAVRPGGHRRRCDRHRGGAGRGQLLQRIAPHLVRPQPFLLPLTRHWQRPYYGAGLLAYDLFASTSAFGRGLPRHRHLSKRALLAEFPGLRADTVVGAIRYYDAQVDDARFVVALARTAAV